MNENETVEEILAEKDSALDNALVDVRRMLARARTHLERGERNYARAVAQDAAEKLSALVG